MWGQGCCYGFIFNLSIGRNFGSRQIRKLPQEAKQELRSRCQSVHRCPMQTRYTAASANDHLLECVTSTASPATKRPCAVSFGLSVT